MASENTGRAGTRPGALVVGASSGMGEALARQLVREGYRVALVARRADMLAALARELNDASASEQAEPVALAYPRDVRDLDAAPDLFARIAREVAPLRLVIYAAGVMPTARPGQPEDFAIEREIMETNTLAAMRWLGLAADELARAGQGAIIGISSVAGDRGRPGNGAYMASKAALSTYLDSLRYQVRGRGVRVLTVKPGYVATEMTAGMKLPKPLTVSAEVAARDILRASAGKRAGGVLYVPRRWRPVMDVIRHLPDAVIGRMRDTNDAPDQSEVKADPKAGLPSATLAITTETLEGYGMRNRARARVASVRSAEDIRAAFAFARRAGLSVALRGSGRSYGDAALNDGQVVVDCTRMNRILAWDAATGVITVEPGVTIADLWRHCLADGWWPPVVPGTMAVSVGGAAAASIHGKNQWQHGSFGEHVLAFDLLLPSGEVLTCSRESHAEVFHAAIGGWGLLGAYTSITLRMRRVHSGLVHVRQTAHGSLDALLTAVDANTRDVGAERATHLVGWIDTAARGGRLGRGLLKTMREFAPGEDANPARTLDPRFQEPSSRLMGVLPVSWVPMLGKPLATPLGTRLANVAQWRRGNMPGAARAHDERYVPANFMLDFIPNFKRVYWPGGLIQHQTFASREAAPDLFRALLRRSQEAGREPSLAVLKAHKPSPFLLNYLPDGYSLALDYAVPRGSEARTLALLDDLNALAVAHGAQFFFAKDSTLTPEHVAAAFSGEALARFAALKARLDPDDLLQSDLYRRALRPALVAASHARGATVEMGSGQHPQS